MAENFFRKSQKNGVVQLRVTVDADTTAVDLTGGNTGRRAWKARIGQPRGLG
jgi:hypothetical protein